MTTIAVCRLGASVSISADGRVVRGGEIESDSLTKIVRGTTDDGYAYAMSSAGSLRTYEFFDFITSGKGLLSLDDLTPYKVRKKLRSFLRKNDYAFDSSTSGPSETGQEIVVAHAGGSYCIATGGEVMRITDTFAIGSGATYARGAMDALLGEVRLQGVHEVGEAMRISTIGVLAARLRDTCSGGRICTAYIDAPGSDCSFLGFPGDSTYHACRKDIQAILEEWSRQHNCEKDDIQATPEDWPLQASDFTQRSSDDA